MKTLDPFDSNIHLLSKVLDLRSANQTIIASNIANAETPGYARKEFQFEKALQTAINMPAGVMLTTHSKHFPMNSSDVSAINGNVIEIKDETGVGDKNGVSVDMEMIALSENELLYETVAQLLKKKLGMLKYSIQEGK
jgi:flagellar basal-body rod protein FlgB